MAFNSPQADWRETRRRSARDAILEAAWTAVAEAGPAGLSMRDLAHRAGTTTPTLYAYFASKNAIYDAMFGQAAREFGDHMASHSRAHGCPEVVVEVVRAFVDFCLADVPRYQLLFQGTIPGFNPSAESYSDAVAALDDTRRLLAEVGITAARHVDLLTAMVTGLVDQQISNDPGGDRWIRLIDELVDMFVAHCTQPTTKRRSQAAQRRKR